MKFRISNWLEFDAAITQVRAEFAKSGYVEITTNGKRRSLDQNGIYHAWLREIVAHKDDGTDVEDWAATIKMEKGFELLRATNADFDDLMRKTVDKLIFADRYDLAHELAKFTQCTSRMDKATFAKLLDWMQMWAWQTMQLRLDAR